MQGFEVGTRLRYRLTLASGLLECLCFAGVVFGYASLVFVLKEDGYFSQLCVSIPGTNGTQNSTGEQLWNPGLTGGLVPYTPTGNIYSTFSWHVGVSLFFSFLQAVVDRMRSSLWSSLSPPSSTTS